MRALILQDKKSIKITEMSIPKGLSKEDILMKVMYCGICRTDAKMWEVGHRDLTLPRILGHEFVGTIKDKKGLFVVWPGISCGKCDFCNTGRENLCDHIKIIGFHRNGGFAEFAIVPKTSLIPVPDEIPAKMAVLAEPIGCAINGVSKLKGKTILVLGAGIMGLMCSMCAREYGYNVYLYDTDKKRLRQSKEIQNELGIVSCEELQYGFDGVINATSSRIGFEQGLDCLNKSGTFCFFSGISNCANISTNIINEFHYKEINLIGSYGCSKKHMKKALNLIKNNQNVLYKFINRCIDATQIEQSLINIIERKYFKIIIDWTIS